MNMRRIMMPICNGDLQKLSCHVPRSNQHLLLTYFGTSGWVLSSAPLLMLFSSGVSDVKVSLSLVPPWRWWKTRSHMLPPQGDMVFILFHLHLEYPSVLLHWWLRVHGHIADELTGVTGVSTGLWWCSSGDCWRQLDLFLPPTLFASWSPLLPTNIPTSSWTERCSRRLLADWRTGKEAVDWRTGKEARQEWGWCREKKRWAL